MAEENAGESKKKGKKKSLLIFGTIGLFFLIGIGAMAFKMGLISTSHQTPDQKAKQPSLEESEMGPILKLTPFIINLKEESGRHYLKTTLILELGEKDWVEPIKEKISSLMDIAILTLSEKRLEELRNPEAKGEIKKELLEKMNQHIEPQKIKQIYFDEFLYQ